MVKYLFLIATYTGRGHARGDNGPVSHSIGFIYIILQKRLFLWQAYMLPHHKNPGPNEYL